MADGTITQVKLSNNKTYDISLPGLAVTPAKINQTIADVDSFFVDNGLTRHTINTLKEVQEWMDVDGAAAQALATEVSNKVNKSGDTMTGKLQFNMSNPHLHMKDTGYNTNWYFQAYQDTLAFGPTYADAVKTDKTGNMWTPGTIQGKYFKSDNTPASIKPSDSNEINLGSNANYIYIGYDNRIGSAGAVDTYKFGCHNGAANASNGKIECGQLTAGGAVKGNTITVANKVTMQYNTSSECLNFTFA